MADLRLIVASAIAAALVASAATAADEVALLAEARQVLEPLPKETGIAEAPVSKERILLGRMLFFDPRLTVDANVSCATCHPPALYGTDALPTSIGVKQRLHPRNAPTVLNAALAFVNHWRGDRESLEDQAAQALTAPISSGLDEHDVVDRLRCIGGYAPLFDAAFPNDAHPVTVKTMAVAIAAYERTLVTPSRFDAYLAGDVAALSSAARAGLQTFIKTGCAACHSGVGIGGAHTRNSASSKTTGPRPGAGPSTKDGPT
jgi:cytochrome c peroxidase